MSIENLDILGLVMKLYWAFGILSILRVVQVEFNSFSEFWNWINLNPFYAFWTAIIYILLGIFGFLGVVFFTREHSPGYVAPSYSPEAKRARKKKVVAFGSVIIMIALGLLIYLFAIQPTRAAEVEEAWISGPAEDMLTLAIFFFMLFVGTGSVNRKKTVARRQKKSPTKKNPTQSR